MTVYPRRRETDKPRRRQWPRLAALVLAGVVAFILAVVYVTGRISNATATDCQQIENLKLALRQTISEAASFARSSPVRSRAEKHASVVFYRDTLARLAPRSCPGERRLLHKQGG